MPLPGSQLEPLRELLKLCAARVVPKAGTHGTGFFVDDRADRRRAA
jgi:hypothetical protein